MRGQPRRSFLHGGVTVGSLLIAGCTSILNRQSSDSPRLGELTALNLDDEPHEFHVDISLNGESVYRASTRVTAASADGAVSAEFEDYPTDPAPYAIEAWVDDQTRADAERLDFSDFDAACLGIELKFGAYGTDLPNPYHSIYYTMNCRLNE